jgi:hypothetical protein
VALTLAAKPAFAAGTILSVGDNFLAAYTEKMSLDHDGLLWTLGGVDATAMLLIPGGVLGVAGVAGRLQWDPATLSLQYDDGLIWNSVGGGGGGAGSYLDWATGYPYTLAAVPVEEVIGQGYFDGSLVVGAVAAYFRAVVDVVFAGAGTCNVLLYDMGAVGVPAPPELITTLTTAVNGGPQVLEQLLAVDPTGPGANKLADSARMYEITVTMTGGAGDTTLVGSSGLDVR